MTVWRVVLTTNERNTEIGDWTGVALECPRQLEPGGPHDDVLGLVQDGFYDGCCPGIVLECGTTDAARYVCDALNQHGVRQIGTADPNLDDTPWFP